MGNLSQHYHTTAATIASALVSKGVPTDEAYLTALDIATMDQMTDWACPANVGTSKATPECVPRITQIDKDSGARLLSGDGFWPSFLAVHQHHFEHFPAIWTLIRANACVDKCSRASLGRAIHLAQDTEGPHRGYVGWPCKENRDRAMQARGKASWYGQAWSWATGLVGQSDESWGHMGDPEADCIERCRADAISAARKLYEAFGGIWGDGKPAFVEAIEDARDDKELAARCHLVFRGATGHSLPAFEPYRPGTEGWRRWCA